MHLLTDVDKEVYLKEAVAQANVDVAERLGNIKEFKDHGCTNPKIDLLAEDTKTGMFPLYFLAIRDKTGTKVSYAIVNGQTGEVAADIPVSFKKYVGFSLIVSIIIFILINSFVVLTPTIVGVIAMLFAVINFVVSAIQLDSIKKEREHSDDKGYKSKNPILKKNDSTLTLLRYVYKELLAFSIPMIVFLANPVEDYYYYGGAIISILLVTLSFSDLIKEHNILVSNKLPQLEKRGGDENA